MKERNNLHIEELNILFSFHPRTLRKLLVYWLLVAELLEWPVLYSCWIKGKFVTDLFFYIWKKVWKEAKKNREKHKGFDVLDHLLVPSLICPSNITLVLGTKWQSWRRSTPPQSPPVNVSLLRSLALCGSGLQRSVGDTQTKSHWREPRFGAWMAMPSSWSWLWTRRKLELSSDNLSSTLKTR